MRHRHKSMRYAKSYQKKQSRIKEKRELKKELRLIEDAQKESRGSAVQM